MVLTGTQEREMSEKKWVVIVDTVKGEDNSGRVGAGTAVVIRYLAKQAGRRSTLRRATLGDRVTALTMTSCDQVLRAVARKHSR